MTTGGAAGLVRCPVCGSGELDPTIHNNDGMCDCPCGHRAYAGYVAELAALTARSQWLAERVLHGDRAPDPDFARRYRIWPVPGLPVGAPGADLDSAASPPPRHTVGVQTVLLTVGAGLLIVAGTVFAAVVWDRISGLGQVALMVTATLGFAAVAVRLHPRLPGTAEALAVVAAGLLVVDVIAAPLLGLLPESWITGPGLYPAVALAIVCVILVLLGRRSGLRAWQWCGWFAAPAAGGALVAFWANQPTSDPASTAAAVSVPLLVSIGLLAVTRIPGRPVPDPLPMRVAGAVGVVVCGLVTASAATSRDSLPGALITTVLATIAGTAWASYDRSRWVRAGAALLIGASCALALGLPPMPQALWLAALVAAVGFVVGLGAFVVLRDTWAAVVAALAVWGGWAVVRIASEPVEGPHSRLQAQVALLAALVAILGFALARWLPWAVWIAAVLGQFALVMGSFDAPEIVESFSLPFTALLLLAGLLWRRYAPGSHRPPSLIWLGPAVAMALIPSAFATWDAPWSPGTANGDVTSSLVRLSAVLIAGGIATIAGARRGLAGLLIPGALALAIVGVGQVWTALANLPRWIALALAGAALILAGARVEWLRGQGARAGHWLGTLR